MLKLSGDDMIYSGFNCEMRFRMANNIEATGKKSEHIGFKEWLKGHDHLPAALAAAVVVAVIIVIVYLLAHKYLWKYTTYETAWSVDVVNASGSGYIAFEDGFIVLNRDGASFYSAGGTQVWSAPYDMRTPTAVSEEGYALIYDQGGRDFLICDKTGKTGEGTTSLAITKGDIAQTGVCVLQTEDSQASLITYYRNNGEELQVSIRTPVATNGYPLDISLSPGGQQLAVSYYYMTEGTGNCRVDFYDFEEGRDLSDKIVASFDYRESGSYVPKVMYVTDSTAYAIGDNVISFFDCTNRLNITKNDAEQVGQIQRLFNGKGRLGVVTSGDEGVYLDIYAADGSREYRLKQDAVFDAYFFHEKNVVMYTSDRCRIESFSGRLRFDMEFGNSIYALMPTSEFGSYYMAAMNAVQKINLK